MVKALGADVLIDYKTQDFETVLHSYDVVLHSQDSETLDKSLRVLTWIFRETRACLGADKRKCLSCKA